MWCPSKPLTLIFFLWTRKWGIQMLVSLAQAAKELSVSIHGLRRWVRERRIAVVRLGRRILIKRKDLDEFVEKNRVSARDDDGK